MNSCNTPAPREKGGPAVPAYTREERRADCLVHVVGLIAAGIAVPALIVLAVFWESEGSVLAAAAIYGASMIAMFAASALYHLLPAPRWKGVLRRLDHAAIYVKIAGTYTPFAVIAAGERAAAILGGVWGAAAVGVALKVLAPGRFEILTLGLYLALGWAVLVIGMPMLEALGTEALILIVTGGLLYTLGVVFHLWDSLPYQNAIWHALVLAASGVFYAAVLVEIARSTGPLMSL